MNDVPKSERVIELYNTVGTALILDFPTGISYTNQAGGTACLQPKAEGVLIPFENDCDINGQFLSLEIDLSKHFESAWGTSGATSGIDARDADAIDDLLRQRNLIEWFHVDRKQLHSSLEAWIRVTSFAITLFIVTALAPIHAMVYLLGPTVIEVVAADRRNVLSNATIDRRWDNLFVRHQWRST